MALDNPASRRRALLNLLDLVQAAAAAPVDGEIARDWAFELELIHDVLRELEAAHPELMPSAEFIVPLESADDALLIEASEGAVLRRGGSVT